MSEQELIELLAEQEHASWARWMEYLFSKCVIIDQEGYAYTVIPDDLVMRWQKQIDTPYERLSEKEKESDRAEVMHILPIIKEYGASLPAKDEWTKAIRSHIQKLNEQEK